MVFILKLVPAYCSPTEDGLAVIIVCMRPANERWHYIATSPLIG